MLWGKHNYIQRLCPFKNADTSTLPLNKNHQFLLSLKHPSKWLLYSLVYLLRLLFYQVAHCFLFPMDVGQQSKLFKLFFSVSIVAPITYHSKNEYLNIVHEVNYCWEEVWKQRWCPFENTDASTPPPIKPATSFYLWSIQVSGGNFHLFMFFIY